MSGSSDVGIMTGPLFLNPYHSTPRLFSVLLEEEMSEAEASAGGASGFAIPTGPRSFWLFTQGRIEKVHEIYIYIEKEMD